MLDWLAKNYGKAGVYLLIAYLGFFVFLIIWTVNLIEALFRWGWI